MPPVQCVGELRKALCQSARTATERSCQSIEQARCQPRTGTAGFTAREYPGLTRHPFSTAAFLNPRGVVFVADIDSDRETPHSNRWRLLEAAP